MRTKLESRLFISDLHTRRHTPITSASWFLTWHSAQVSTRWLLLNFVESQRNVESLVSLWDQLGERQKFDGAVMQNRLHLAG